MAFVELNTAKLKKNYDFLDNLFKEEGIEWSVVTKLLCGNIDYIREIIKLGPKELCDSRISNLKAIKQIDDSIQTVYIKPPAKENIEDIVKYADVSFNTELETIGWISNEAVRQNKTHKVIIMIELGDLREGVMGEELIDFYAAIFRLPRIEISGIGTNLNCLHGIMPSQDKLIQLCLYKQLIEAKFNQKIPWVTGGTSVMIPLLFKKQVPNGVNHFRVGETLFFGNDLFENKVVQGMEGAVLKLYTQIIEITEKPKIPIGVMEANPSGDLFEVDESEYGKTSYRAIIDLGLLDISSDYLIPEDDSLKIIGASSDMMVIDLDENDKNYKVGDIIPFEMKYMGALALLNSDYIEKRLV